MRTYHNPENVNNAVEMEWLVGSIPITKGGKEVVMRYSTAGQMIYKQRLKLSIRM